MKFKLTTEQRLMLRAWAAELLRLPEINERAAKCDPPFTVDYLQLKWARRKASVRFREDLARMYAEASARGVAQR